MNPPSQFEVVKPGLETTVQELPGRLGHWEQGIPPSGPVDFWSFRLANLLVGNPRDTAALECQVMGPTLRLHCSVLIAITGAEMSPTLDGQPIPMWTTVIARAGQTLALRGSRVGMRSYIAFSGGIATTPVLGSRAVFHMAGIGGRALQPGQTLPLGVPGGDQRGLYHVDEAHRPPLGSDESRSVACVRGPNDDWLSDESLTDFVSSDWKVQAQSNRTGMRLSGPVFSFAHRATHKRPEHGQDPSNILDHGYPLGAINLAGQTPIILINDAPSTGGFINPFTVPSAEFWKLGQVRPHEILRFHEVSLDEAQQRRRDLDSAVTQEALTPQ
ncbi:biotin-dependent carboxyltransferase family protein [Halotalea alkalilenta]|uniref:Aminopeptidase n=1 Tax=Halotalea alkalilenta TaxID=376489 RepID=A0A172YEJ3_9GAMM|nr:biotin-dependent carboxyltransferase family protein [Halotalea alkalilenta]ANF57678.1 aminopeptidase [Halotalea alkalilenta]